MATPEETEPPATQEDEAHKEIPDPLVPTEPQANPEPHRPAPLLCPETPDPTATPALTDPQDPPVPTDPTDSQVAPDPKDPQATTEVMAAMEPMAIPDSQDPPDPLANGVFARNIALLMAAFSLKTVG
jgi:hypothetical protein